MRFAGDYDETFPGQWQLWEASLERAMSGRRGQQSLRDLEQALLELPEKRLISGRLANEGEVCVVGALVAHRRVADGETREQVLSSLEQMIPEEDQWGYTDEWEAEQETILQAESVGLSLTIACTLSQLNDDFYKATPEERYEKVLAWVRARIIEEPVAA
jgi:hypothetical protein